MAKNDSRNSDCRFYLQFGLNLVVLVPTNIDTNTRYIEKELALTY